MESPLSCSKTRQKHVLIWALFLDTTLALKLIVISNRLYHLSFLCTNNMPWRAYPSNDNLFNQGPLDLTCFECMFWQVSTNTGIISRKVQLKVVTPEAFILGADGLSFVVYPQGSKISLVCVLEKVQSPPQ